MINLLIIGLVAGWLVNRYYRKSNPGLLKNLILGVGGSLLGGGVARFLGIYWTSSVLSQLVIASAGSVLLLWLLQKWEESDAKNKE